MTESGSVSATTTREGPFRIIVDGVRCPLLIEGKPLHRFAPGWRPVFMNTTLLPSHSLLLLEHGESGRKTVWFLDEMLNFRGAGLKNLGTEDHAKVMKRLQPLFLITARSALFSAARARPPELRTLNSEAITLCSLLLPIWMQTLEAPRILKGIPEAGLSLSPGPLAESNTPISVPAARLQLLADMELATDHEHSVPVLAPCSGTALYGTFCVKNDTFIIQRFSDITNGQVFFIGSVKATSPNSLVPFLFFPAENTIVLCAQDDEAPTSEIALASLPALLCEAYLSRPEGFSNTMTQSSLLSSMQLGAVSSLGVRLPSLPSETPEYAGEDWQDTVTEISRIFTSSWSDSPTVTESETEEEGNRE